MQGTVWPLSPARETKEKEKMITQLIKHTTFNNNNALRYLNKLTRKQNIFNKKVFKMIE